MVQDLGGEENCSAMQMTVLESWWRVSVLENAWMRIAMLSDWPERPNLQATDRAKACGDGRIKTARLPRSRTARAPGADAAELHRTEGRAE